MDTIELDSFRDFNFAGILMPMISVFNNPEDFKGKFVARLWNVTSVAEPTPYAVIKNSIESIRSEIPSHMVVIPRTPEDLPALVETWI